MLGVRFGLTDPAPSVQVSKTFHLHETVGKDTGKSRCTRSNEVEDRVTLLELKASVPCGHEVGAPREETSLQYTEDDAETDHLLPLLDETESL